MARRIHQVLAGFADGDAISSEATILQGLLRNMGIESEIFADTDHISPVMKSKCRSLGECAGSRADVLIHHYSIASPAVDVFTGSPAKKILIYHNITPAHFFNGFDDSIARKLNDARAGLRAILPRMEASWAVSKYDAQELVDMGARNARVFPLLFDAGALDVQADPNVFKKFAAPMRNILFVGRVAPNKRIEDLILAFAWYDRTISRNVRLIIVGSERSCPRYYLMLKMLARELDLPNMCFERFASPAGLPAYYEMADVFVTASEHEGYCLPLVEAMYKGVPVIARRTGGMPEALGGAGVLYEDATPAELAQLTNRVLVDGELRKCILDSQERRVAEIKARRPEEELKALLAEVG